MFKRFAALRKLYDKQLATEMAGRKKVKLSSKESQRLALERSAAEIKQRLLDAASTSPSATSPAAEPSASASSAGSPATAASATSDPSATAAATAAAPGAVESASGKPVQTTASVGKRKKKSVPSQVSENSPALDKSTSDKN